MSGGPVGDWSWDGQAKRLTLAPKAGAGIGALGGKWRLEDLSKTVDGLSASRLKRSFSGSIETVSCELTLADGRVLSLFGGKTDTGAAGLILEGAGPVLEDGPGPDLQPVYQPIFDVTGARITGFEALARWDGVSDPAERLEDTALASNMLIRAVNALVLWREESGRDDLFVQVNLTGQDLADESLPGLVSALISGYGLGDGVLRLELTEQAALRDTDGAVNMARALKETGARLVLDDFGSGHSSFLWLAQLPADSLKIDAALIAEVGTDRVQTILHAITRLADELGMGTVAEGVEDRAILPLLAELGFRHVQGFALGRPVKARDAVALLT
ncbi:EAL domain-containing protein [Hyphomonas sp. FCG-A18]|uniref:EAL domain-containing protein n=1 Tax=Hyphomonas sp. FCG-A18 TaxID=3080019 RepID=UPI002B2ABED6|nr:EAL domain-containing protein [Hyphomonas sp. FCG-A18]